MKNGRFNNLFDLIKKKFNDPDRIIAIIQQAREISDITKEKTREEILVEMQKNRKLVNLMMNVPRDYRVRMTVVDLLVEESLEENGNEDGHPRIRNSN